MGSFLSTWGVWIEIRVRIQLGLIKQCDTLYELSGLNIVGCSNELSVCLATACQNHSGTCGEYGSRSIHAECNAVVFAFSNLEGTILSASPSDLEGNKLTFEHPVLCLMGGGRGPI